MFTLKLLNSSIRSICLGQRHLSAGSGRLQAIFKQESVPEENTLAVIDDDEEDPEERQKSIYAMRNKSRLYPQHRNLLHDRVPYKSAESWIHETLKYQRKIYGKYGSSSNVDPRTCFWTEEELAEKKEYERVAFPVPVPEMIKLNEEQKKSKRDNIIERENNIAKNLAKLGQWKRDITARKEKKETDARVAKERKDRLIEEVRRHFGFTMDSRDERFKELLEKKEKEQKKAMKESKKAEKAAKLAEKLLGENASQKSSKKLKPKNVEKEEDKDEDRKDDYDDKDDDKKK